VVLSLCLASNSLAVPLANLVPLAKSLRALLANLFQATQTNAVVRNLPSNL
jgi:hypothetical protein